MKFIKIRKPLKNLNEVLKHTEMPQKFYGNASKKRGNASRKRGNASTKFSFKTFFKKRKRLKKNGNASKKRGNASTK